MGQPIYCTQCGTKVYPYERYCPKCGSAIRSPDDSATDIGDTQRPAVATTSADSTGSRARDAWEWYLSLVLLAKAAWAAAAVLAVLFLGAWTVAQVWDRDCKDFRTQADAQRFWHLNGGPILDFHHLDGDSDGRACESLR